MKTGKLRNAVSNSLNRLKLYSQTVVEIKITARRLSVEERLAQDVWQKEISEGHPRTNCNLFVDFFFVCSANKIIKAYIVIFGKHNQ